MGGCQPAPQACPGGHVVGHNPPVTTGISLLPPHSTHPPTHQPTPTNSPTNPPALAAVNPPGEASQEVLDQVILYFTNMAEAGGLGWLRDGVCNRGAHYSCVQAYARLPNSLPALVGHCLHSCGPIITGNANGLGLCAVVYVEVDDTRQTLATIHTGERRHHAHHLTAQSVVGCERVKGWSPFQHLPGLNQGCWWGGDALALG